MPAPRSAPRALAVVLAATLALAGVSACSDDGDEKKQGSSTTGPGMDPQKNRDAAQGYFEAVASNDPEVQADALEFAAPQSPAATYLSSAQDVAEAYVDAGETRPADEVSETEGTYRVCAGAGARTCTTYSQVTLVDGRVNTFTVQGRPVEKRTASGTGAVSDLGTLGTVEFLSRGTTRDGLLVTLHVTAGDAAVEPGDATFRDAAGRRFTPSRVVAPERIEAGADANVLLVIDGAAPGRGTLEYAVSSPGGGSGTARLRTR